MAARSGPVRPRLKSFGGAAPKCCPEKQVHSNVSICAVRVLWPREKAVVGRPVAALCRCSVGSVDWTSFCVPVVVFRTAHRAAAQLPTAKEITVITVQDLELRAGARLL